jgi:hypothetical protein
VYIHSLTPFNKTGNDIEVRASANNKELFSQKVASKVKMPAEGEGEGIVHPPPGKYPIFLFRMSF